MKRIRTENNNQPARWDAIYRSENAERWTIWNDDRLVKLFAERLPENAHVLDLGSGNGLAPRLISRWNGDFGRPDLTWSAADHSAGAVEFMRGLGFPWRGLYLADLEKPLPFRDGAFDAVMCTEVLEHLENPAAAVAEMKRIARAVFVSVPNQNATDTDFHVWSLDKADLEAWLPGAIVQPMRADAILVAMWGGK